MLLIAVCDDDASDRRKLSEAIETKLQNQCVDRKVLTYDSAEKLILAIEDKKLRFDIIFLDIVMGDMDGMACARLIRQQDTQVFILFLTSSADYVYEGYEVGAAAYLVKPINADKLAAALDKTLSRIDSLSKECISITSGGVTQQILIKDILYLESRKNKVEIVIAQTNENVPVYTTMDRFTQLYPSPMWIRAHKSFTANFLYIEQYSHDKFVLRDGTVIPISRIYRHKAKEDFYTLLHDL